MTDAERARRYRDKLRGGPPRELRPCGTRAAKVRHRRRGEECEVCWPPTSDKAGSAAMDDLPPDTPVPTVEYETCERCKGTLYRGVALDGKTRGPWHHHDRRMKHEPELHPVGEEEMIVDLEIGYSAEAAQQDAAGYGDSVR